MPFDGLVLAAVQNELENKMAGARIERIYQPHKDELILLLHRPGNRQRLVLSANARNARVHLTDVSRENPITPPLFAWPANTWKVAFFISAGRLSGC